MSWYWHFPLFQALLEEKILKMNLFLICLQIPQVLSFMLWSLSEYLQPHWPGSILSSWFMRISMHSLRACTYRMLLLVAKQSNRSLVNRLQECFYGRKVPGPSHKGEELARQLSVSKCKSNYIMPTSLTSHNIVKNENSTYFMELKLCEVEQVGKEDSMCELRAALRRQIVWHWTGLKTCKTGLKTCKFRCHGPVK